MKNAGKRLSALFAALMMFVMSAANCMTAFAADDVSAVPITVKYDQAGARSMLEMINNFRTGSDAWYRNEDGSKKVLSGLSEFEYDYGLEQAAMQRAAEIAVVWDHIRPNGEWCDTAADGYLHGENIAAGYPTVAAAFEGWQETDEDCAGQGHRRNMLNNYYPCIGIAHATVNGVNYWVQDFGYATGAAKKDVGTGAMNVNVDILKSSIDSITLTPSSGSITVPLGGSASVPTVAVNAVLIGADRWAGNITGTTTPNWSVSGNAVSVSGGKINGNALGSATLTANLYGKSVSVNIKVECTNHKWSGWNTTAAATCTKDGKQTRTCSACGAIEEQVIKAKGHSYGEYKVVRKATASQEGLEERVCSVCGDKQQRTIAKIVTTTTKKTTTPKATTTTKKASAANTTAKTTAPKTTTKTTSGGNTSKTTTANSATESGTTTAEAETDPGSENTTPQESDTESETTTAEVTTVEVTTPQESEVTTAESDESDESTESEVTTTENSEITKPDGNNSADSENSNGKKVLFIVLGGAGGLTAVGVIFAIIRKIRR